ncbi:MAG TPA: hypothetical protein VMW08_02655 [Acidimicrobiales bacterium]|nr:hypothetical protein [Acidimicrobiales bacterium]
MSATTSSQRRQPVLRWLAFVPATIGLILAFVALIWTEWLQLLAAAAMLAIAAAIWRVGNGSWSLAGTEDTVRGGR